MQQICGVITDQFMRTNVPFWSWKDINALVHFLLVVVAHIKAGQARIVADLADLRRNCGCVGRTGCKDAVENDIDGVIALRGETVGCLTVCFFYRRR